LKKEIKTEMFLSLGKDVMLKTNTFTHSTVQSSVVYDLCAAQLGQKGQAAICGCQSTSLICEMTGRILIKFIMGVHSLVKKKFKFTWQESSSTLSALGMRFSAGHCHRIVPRTAKKKRGNTQTKKLN
jgi:hypothetical protein